MECTELRHCLMRNIQALISVKLPRLFSRLLIQVLFKMGQPLTSSKFVDIPPTHTLSTPPPNGGGASVGLESPRPAVFSINKKTKYYALITAKTPKVTSKLTPLFYDQCSYWKLTSVFKSQRTRQIFPHLNRRYVGKDILSPTKICLEIFIGDQSFRFRCDYVRTFHIFTHIPS